MMIGDLKEEHYLRDSFLGYAQKLWNEWELQCMVLASFALQAFLLLAAHIRKRNTSTVLRILLWLAYVMADYVAVFVLGHLTIQTNDPRHQLVLLWAPVLLVHLGGQDTMTAFSMEDNELWKRHLLGLVSQVVMAAYVIAKSWAWPDKSSSSRRRLLAPLILMFVPGIVKYAERTWALKMATPETLKGNRMDELFNALKKYDQNSAGSSNKGKEKEGSSSDTIIHKYNQEILGRKKWWQQEEYADLVLAAGDSLPNCMNVLTDIPAAPWVLPNVFDMIEAIYRRDKKGGNDRFSSRAYKLGEIQLSLIYDRLYTKAGLRYHFRPIISVSLQLLTLGATWAALLLFATARKKGSAYSRVDIAVTYILLAGAVTLELLSMLMFVLSYRFYYALSGRFGAVNRPTKAIFRAIRLVRPYHKPLWSNKWEQYNLIAGCIKESQAGVLGRMVRCIGLAGDTTLSIISGETKELICNELDDEGRCERFTHVRGDEIMKRRGHDQSSDLCRSITGVDFSTSLVTWHLVTDICFFLHDGRAQQQQSHMRLSREVSNYLMDLVMVRRLMISSEGHVAHLKARNEVTSMLLAHHNSKKKVSVKDVEAIKKMLVDGMSSAADSGQQAYAQFARNEADTMRPVLPRAWRLAQTLLHGTDQPGTMWELIASVWMEMLFHLAAKCDAGFHAKNLSSGGEFLTHVRFLLHNRGFGWNFVLART